MKSIQIKIRKASPGDIKEVYDLILAFAKFQRSSEFVRITPEKLLSEMDDFKCLVVEFEEKLIGFASYCFTYHSWSGKAIYLDDIFLLEKFRGKGIGSQLFESVKEIGVRNNCFKMEWRVSDWNAYAQEFYKIKGASIGNEELNCELKL